MSLVAGGVSAVENKEVYDAILSDLGKKGGINKDKILWISNKLKRSKDPLKLMKEIRAHISKTIRFAKKRNLDILSIKNLKDVDGGGGLKKGGSSLPSEWNGGVSNRYSSSNSTEDILHIDLNSEGGLLRPNISVINGGGGGGCKFNKLRKVLDKMVDVEFSKNEIQISSAFKKQIVLRILENIRHHFVQ
jgi:hypothetical protein